MLFHGRIAARAERRRALTIDDTGVTIAPRPFSRFIAPWSQLAAVDIADHEARVKRKDGRTQRIVWEWKPRDRWLPLCERTAVRLD